MLTHCVSSSLIKLTYRLARSPLRPNAREASVLNTSKVDFRGSTTMPTCGFHSDTPNQKWMGKSNHGNANNSSHACQAKSSPQGTNMERLHSISHSAPTNGTTKFSSDSPVWSDRQSTNYRYPDTANNLSRSSMPVDAAPTLIPIHLAMRSMLLHQPKYKNYFVAPEELHFAWKAVLLSRHITNLYSAAAAASANLLPSKSSASKRRKCDQLSAVLKRLRKIGKPHSVPSLSTLLNTFIHAACLTDSGDRETLHRVHTAEWIAFADQLHQAVQNLLSSKTHAASYGDITVSDLSDAYAALYHLHFPKNCSSRLDVAVKRICSSLDQLAVALLGKMTTSDALQLADWTLINRCDLTGNFNHHFIKRWFSALENFSHSTKHSAQHAALPSAEECLRVMFQLVTMRFTAPDNLVAILERILVGRDARWNTNGGTTTILFTSAAKQQPDHPNSLDDMSDIKFAVMCNSFFRTKSCFRDVETFVRVLQRAGKYVQEMSARAASGADQSCDAEVALEQKFTYEISFIRRSRQQKDVACTSAETVILNSIVKCILMNARRSDAQIIEPFISIVRRTLTAVGDKRNNDFLQSVFGIPILARVAAITCDIGLRDEVLLDLVFKRIVAMCRLRPERIRIKHLALLLEVYATLTYVPNECNNSHDEEQFFSFFEKQIGSLVKDGNKHDSEIMRRPELFVQSVWHLATLGHYSPTVLNNLLALLHKVDDQHDNFGSGPKTEDEVGYFVSPKSSSRQRRQPANATGLAVLRWCVMLERPNFDWRNISVKPTIPAAADQNNDESMQHGEERRSKHACCPMAQSLQDDAEDDEVHFSSILNSPSEIPGPGWLQRVKPLHGAFPRRKMYDDLCFSINQVKWPSSKNHAANKVDLARLLHLTPYAEPSVVLRVDRASGKPLPFDERVASLFNTAVDASDLQEQQQQQQRLSSPTGMNVNLIDGNQHARYIALIFRNECHYFESIKARSRHLLGHWRMQERHLRMMGFHPVSIDHSHLQRVLESKYSVSLIALLRNAVRSIE